MKNPKLRIPKKNPGFKSPFYRPEVLRGLGFTTLQDSINYKMRLENDPMFALKRKEKGIHPGEGIIQDPVPIDTPSLIPDKNPIAPEPAGHLSLNSVDPIQHQANSELNFSRFQTDQGKTMMGQGKVPQTSAEEQNLRVAQQQSGSLNNPSFDPFKDQKQNQCNPFIQPYRKPPGM